MNTVEIIALMGRVNLALSAGILLVLILRIPARRVFGARVAYALWLAPPLAALAVMLPTRVRTVIDTTIDLGPQMGTETVAAAVQIPLGAVAYQVTPPVSLFQGVMILWLAGAFAALVLLALRQRRFLQIARAGTVGPAVVGVVSPRVIQPADFTQRFSPKERVLVMEHERTHLARHDSRINAALAFVQSLFWFNPLIYAGGYFLRIDQELACDEVVIARFPASRSVYAGALLKTQLAGRPLPLGCYWPSRSQHPLVERIAMLKRHHPSLSRRLAGMAAVSALAAGLGAGAWAAMPDRIVHEFAAPEAAAQPPGLAAIAEALEGQPEAPAAELPREICLTNACSPGAGVDLTGLVKANSIAEAIKLGNAHQVRAMGGTVEQVGQASAERFARRLADATPETLEGQQTVANNYGRFFNTSNGATLSWSDDTSGQLFLQGTDRVVSGAIVRRNPDGTERTIWMTTDGGLVGQIPAGQVAIGNGLAINPPPGYTGPVVGQTLTPAQLQEMQQMIQAMEAAAAAGR